MKTLKTKIKCVRLIIILLVLSYGQCIFSQSYMPTKEDLEAFFKTKTLVVLEDNPLLLYNINIKEVVEKHWTITPFEFISFKEFEEKRVDPQYSFLLMTQVTFANDKLDARYDFLQLLLGKNTFRVNQMPELCSVPLCYHGVYEDSYVYKLGTLVRFIQKHMNNLKKDPGMLSSNVLEQYNKNMKNIQGKTLYLVEDELAKEVNSVARIKSVYPYKVRIVTREDIEEAINNEDENVVFLHKVGPEGTRIHARCYKVLIGAKDGEFYYFDYHMINNKNPDGFLESDFKKLAKKQGK